MKRLADSSWSSTKITSAGQRWWQRSMPSPPASWLLPQAELTNQVQLVVVVVVRAAEEEGEGQNAARKGPWRKVQPLTGKRKTRRKPWKDCSSIPHARNNTFHLSLFLPPSPDSGTWSGFMLFTENVVYNTPDNLFKPIISSCMITCIMCMWILSSLDPWSMITRIQASLSCIFYLCSI